MGGPVLPTSIVYLLLNLDFDVFISITTITCLSLVPRVKYYLKYFAYPSLNNYFNPRQISKVDIIFLYTANYFHERGLFSAIKSFSRLIQNL